MFVLVQEFKSNKPNLFSICEAEGLEVARERAERIMESNYDIQGVEVYELVAHAYKKEIVAWN